jgi:hypothetical protein
MKNRPFLVILTLVVGSAFAGCGPSKEERDAKERQRLLLEQQAQRDIQKSNDAVNEVSKKLGKKPPALDLGLPAEKKAEPTPPTTEPARKP